MRRWTLRILLCLVFGVVTTVGVAWVLAASFNTPDQNFRLVYFNGWMGSIYEDEPGAIVIGLAPFVRPDGAFGGGLPYWSRAIQTPPSTELLSLHEYGYGWPETCLRFEIETVPGATVQSIDFVLRGGVHIGSGLAFQDGDDFSAFRAIPLRPIPPGFLINTLFYALLWFGLFFGLDLTRQTIRRRRGRCPSCGYDLRGDFDNGCSECGWGREEQGEDGIADKR